jgi:hypothetical protein
MRVLFIVLLQLVALLCFVDGVDSLDKNIPLAQRLGIMDLCIALVAETAAFALYKVGKLEEQTGALWRRADNRDQALAGSPSTGPKA